MSSSDHNQDSDSWDEGSEPSVRREAVSFAGDSTMVADIDLWIPTYQESEDEEPDWLKDYQWNREEADKKTGSRRQSVSVLGPAVPRTRSRSVHSALSRRRTSIGCTDTTVEDKPKATPKRSTRKSTCSHSLSPKPSADKKKNKLSRSCNQSISLADLALFDHKNTAHSSTAFSCNESIVSGMSFATTSTTVSSILERRDRRQRRRDDKKKSERGKGSQRSSIYDQQCNNSRRFSMSMSALDNVSDHVSHHMLNDPTDQEDKEEVFHMSMANLSGPPGPLTARSKSDGKSHSPRTMKKNQQQQPMSDLSAPAQLGTRSRSDGKSSNSPRSQKKGLMLDTSAPAQLGSRSRMDHNDQDLLLNQSMSDVSAPIVGPPRRRRSFSLNTLRDSGTIPGRRDSMASGRETPTTCNRRTSRRQSKWPWHNTEGSPATTEEAKDKPLRTNSDESQKLDQSMKDISAPAVLGARSRSLTANRRTSRQESTAVPNGDKRRKESTRERTVAKETLGDKPDKSTSSTKSRGRSNRSKSPKQPTSGTTKSPRPPGRGSNRAKQLLKKESSDSKAMNNGSTGSTSRHSTRRQKRQQMSAWLQEDDLPPQLSTVQAKTQPAAAAFLSASASAESASTSATNAAQMVAALVASVEKNGVGSQEDLLKQLRGIMAASEAAATAATAAQELVTNLSPTMGGVGKSASCHSISEQEQAEGTDTTMDSSAGSFWSLPSPRTSSSSSTGKNAVLATKYSTLVNSLSQMKTE